MLAFAFKNAALQLWGHTSSPRRRTPLVRSAKPRVVAWLAWRQDVCRGVAEGWW